MAQTKAGLWSVVVSLLVVSPALAEEAIPLPPEKKKEIMALALEGMWGKAKGRDGNLLQPADDKQRTTIPVSEKMAEEIMRVGIMDGIASWCKVPAWEPHYLLYMQRVRRAYQDDIAIAYASVLHGVMQGIMESPPNQSACDEATRDNIAKVIESDTVQLEEVLTLKRTQFTP